VPDNRRACSALAGIGEHLPNKQNVIFSKMTLLANISCEKIRYSPTCVWLKKTDELYSLAKENPTEARKALSGESD
jgi:hypothetical protein